MLSFKTLQSIMLNYSIKLNYINNIFVIFKKYIQKMWENTKQLN